MYLNSGVDYFVTLLDGLFVVCESGVLIQSPNIKFKLLSYPDMSKIDLMYQSKMSVEDIYEEIIEKCVVEVIGFPEEKIDFNESSAGIFKTLAIKILENSKMLVADLEQSFNSFTNTTTLLDQLALVVGYYTHLGYEKSKELPIDELLKRYALCCKGFSQTVPPIVLQEEVESKVGG